MDHYTHYVGIDVSKHTLDVMLWHRHQGAMIKAACQTSNDAPGHQQLTQWLTEHRAPIETTVLCLEHTGRYDDALLEHLTLGGWICALEKTTVLQKVKPEHHRKDDAFDADLLAEYAYRYSDKLSLYQACDPVIEQIRLLYGERRRLVTHRATARATPARARLQPGRQAKPGRGVCPETLERAARFLRRADQGP